MELGSTFGTLDAKLTAALAATPAAAANAVHAQLVAQLGAAFPVMRECCTLAALAGLPTGDLHRFAQCGRLVVGAGSQTLLERLASKDMPRLLQKQQQAAQPAALQDASPESRLVANSVVFPLEAAGSLLTLLHGSEEKQALAAEVLAASQLPRWLQALASMLLASAEAGARCCAEACHGMCMQVEALLPLHRVAE